jgi:hypothetical protein
LEREIKAFKRKGMEELKDVDISKNEKPKECFKGLFYLVFVLLREKKMQKNLFLKML